MNIGDCGFFDGGDFFFCGCDKDVFVFNGCNIDFFWVESVVVLVDGVFWGGVVVVSWEFGVEEGECFVVLVEWSFFVVCVDDDVVEDLCCVVLCEMGLCVECVVFFLFGDLLCMFLGKY